MKIFTKLLGAALAILLAISVLGCDSSSKTGSSKVYRGTPDTGPVDAQWQEVLKQNGTFYEAFLGLSDIMKKGPANHPDDVKLPKELRKQSYDGTYYTKKYPLRGDSMQSAKEAYDMKKVAGRWVVVQDIMTDYGQLIGHIANGYHLILKEDGTGTFDKYGAIDGDSYIKPVKWDGRKINLTFPNAMDGYYTIDGNRMILCMRIRAKLEEIFVLERESDFMANLPLSPGMVLQLGATISDESFSSNAVIDGPDLGKELPGQVYRMTQWSEGGKVTKASSSDPTTNPADHFVVLVQASDRGGYGYFRSGDTEDAWFFPLGDTDKYRNTKKDISFALLHDTFFYWDKKDNIFEYWLIDRPNYGWEKKYGRFELSGNTLKWYPRYFGALSTDLCVEYELTQGEKPPVSHTSVGPMNNRKFEIPDGPRTKAGFWRLDRIMGYNDYVKPPMTLKDKEKYQKDQADKMAALAMKDPMALKKFQESLFIYGEDVRKYGTDLWYVLNPDGTGYMRVWDKYFELVWNDDMIYYYDISGRHILSIGVGTILADKGGIAQVRLFKDELNPAPPRPKELGGK